VKAGITGTSHLNESYIMNKGVSFAAACGAFSLLLTTAALALSIALPPGATVAVPPTTAATEPDLAGVAIRDALIPFQIHSPSGALLCAGQLQDRVVRSSRTGLLDFYYAIRITTKGTGAIARVARRSYDSLPLRVAYRMDGLGVVPPTRATRSSPGLDVAFAYLKPPVSCATPQISGPISRFVLIRTGVKAFKLGGLTQIVTTSGAQTVLKTAQP